MSQFIVSERRFSSQNRKVIREKLKFGHFFARKIPRPPFRPLFCDETATNRLQPRKYSLRPVVRGPPCAYHGLMAIVSPAARSEEERFSLPWDLTEWIDAQSLRGWVDEEIDTLDWSNPELATLLAQNPRFRPRTLLTLLNYAYATGTYESEEISVLCATDPAFREICGEDAPGTRALGRRD